MTGFVDDDSIVSWGRTLRGIHMVARPAFADELPALIAASPNAPFLPIGLRRSYGDSGLNVGGRLLDMTGLDRLVGFDPESGVVTAEAGLSLAALNAWAVPRGWFVPVTPGTKFVTLAGAVANDVHGKNHAVAGTFGRWVREIVLARTDGMIATLTPSDNTGLFAATIGGLGLTGVILRVAVQLRQIPGPGMSVETVPFATLRDYFSLSSQAHAAEYAVAWVDCLAGGRGLGRGLLSRADHTADLVVAPRPAPSVPFDFPAIALNRFSIAAFNRLYYAAGRLRRGRARVHLERYFYPLDRIGQWNRIYGRRGMYQYQSVVPPDAAEAATTEMLRQITRAGEGSFLVVLKDFGELTSPGMLSFPMAGTTLALDFPNRGATTLRLLDRLDAIVREARGRLYPAKDGRLPPKMFRLGYPRLDEFCRHLDPGLSSSFWRRMGM